MTYEIIEQIRALSDPVNGTTKEINLVSYNGKEPKFDIRAWKRDEHGERMFKGVTLTEAEAKELQAALNEYFC